MEEVQKTRIKEMQEVDAKIEKINYDLLGIESRKKEIEDKKAEKQKEIEKLEKERLTMRSEDMNKARKVIYIIVNLQKDLKEIDSLNSKIIKLKSETEDMQGKIDIQNKLYLEARNEKDKLLEDRRKLYLSNETPKEKTETTKENNNSKEQKVSREEKFILNLNRLIEQQINAHLNKTKENSNSNEAEDEME